MQGYLFSIARHYLAGIKENELKRITTIRDFLKRDNVFNQQSKFFADAKREQEEFSNGQFGRLKKRR